jgi:hypothetical protein
LLQAAIPVLLCCVLRRFIRGGTLFDNFYVTPQCAQTRAELLTGRSYARTGTMLVHGGEPAAAAAAAAAAEAAAAVAPAAAAAASRAASAVVKVAAAAAKAAAAAAHHVIMLRAITQLPIVIVLAHAARHMQQQKSCRVSIAGTYQ